MTNSFSKNARKYTHEAMLQEANGRVDCRGEVCDRRAMASDGTMLNAPADSQRILSAEQVEAFYHDEFVNDQVRDFAEMARTSAGDGVVVDVGGGCGFFAGALQQRHGLRTRVIDLDPGSIEACERAGVEAMRGDALDPPVTGNERVACFNLILHHLVGGSESATRALQVKALRAWVGRAERVFVNEYIYQSNVRNLSGRLIFEITSSKILSFAGRQVARIIPSFRANTFGVGVRFRAHDEWRKLFAEAGFRVADTRLGEAEHVSAPLRLLLIDTIRRDSFLLEPIGSRTEKAGASV